LKHKGCSGLSYSLEFTDKINKLDEVVEQNGNNRKSMFEGHPLFLGLKLIVDSKAIMAIIGTEMDYNETDLSNEFVFNNPNIKEQCGCGQSFSV
jgi:iron-sulfur cluster assembly accessory protein